MISRTSYNSLKKGELAKGCLSCVRGCKAVIFVTGVCSRNCYFCPTSDQKNKNDVTYANERPLANTDEKTMIKGIIEEAERQKARGAGLTGGDPLSRLERTVTIIKALKQEFGKAFHCHLYTILNLVDEKKLKMLYDAGLDEIRFHPDLDDQKLWERIGIAQKFDWDIGVEIPAIPGKETETKALIDFTQDKVQFINLNELEIADNSQNALLGMGYETKDYLSYAVDGSEKLAHKMLQYIDNTHPKLHAHFCTAQLKDGTQLTKRIRRTGRNVKRPFEKITEEGLVIHGIVKLPSLDNDDKERTLKKLSDLKENITFVNQKELIIDDRKLRIITSVQNAKKISRRRKDLECSITTEYPTWDQLEIETEYL